MRSSAVRRFLAALLPGELRRDVFEPAAYDLDADRLREGRGPARLGIVLLFLECWRLAPAEVFSMFLNDLRHAFRLLRRDPVFTTCPPASPRNKPFPEIPPRTREETISKKVGTSYFCDRDG